MKPLRLIRTTTIKLAFYILAENDKKYTLFDYICFRDVKHKPIDFSPSDRIKTERQIGDRKILKVLKSFIPVHVIDKPFIPCLGFWLY